ncbi:MAG: hypothetical protein R3E42_16915 [Burkholderiaceae bacterium]
MNTPPERQQQSDAYASAQLTEDDKAWLRSHTDSCDPRLHEATLWPSRLGSDLALCHGSPAATWSTCWRPRWTRKPGWPRPTRLRSGLVRIPPHIRLLACGHSHVARSWR